MNVPMLDPQRSNAPYRTKLEQAALNVIRSGKYILGPEVEAFEKACAVYLDCNEAIAVSSGTDALVLALMTYGIGSGDEVICPSFTFFATAGAISRVGAKPVFVDIFPDCFTCNTDAIHKAITPRTKAIIPVHLFGQSADMKEIMKIATVYNLLVIEDACQAIGTEDHGKKVGTIGDVGCFSFFPSKNLGGFGDSGLVTTNNKFIAQELRAMRVHGGKQQYVHERVGGNFRIDALQAAMLNVKLEYLPEAEGQRIDNAKRYIDNLSNCKKFSLPPIVRGKHIFNQFTLRVPNEGRDPLQSFLKGKGISSAVYYPLPLHQQLCFKDIIPEGLSLPETERAAREVLSIPIASELSNDELSYVIESLLEFDSL